MAKYLDYDGLSYLWQKIDARIDSKVDQATSVLYETINLTVTLPLGGVSTTVYVNRDGLTDTYEYNSSTITIKVPADTSYTISVADIDNYNTPTPINRTSIPGNYITLSLLYWVPATGNGTFIVDANGYLRDVNTWVEGSNATGVYVSDGVRFLIMAPKRQEYKWGGYRKFLSNIFTTSNGTTAITDFAGSSNTDQIISQLKGVTVSYKHHYTGESGTITGAPAAEYCRAYSNGCKKAGEWYLPSAGEMNLLMINKNAINSALAKISGQSLSSEWTSTQYNRFCAWYNNWDRYEYFYYKYEDYYVRPVCSL